MEVEKAPRVSGRFSLDRMAQEQMSKDLGSPGPTPRNPLPGTLDYPGTRIFLIRS